MDIGIKTEFIENENKPSDQIKDARENSNEMDYAVPIIKIEYIESPSNIKVEHKESYVKSETVAEEFVSKDGANEKMASVHIQPCYGANLSSRGWFSDKQSSLS
ncbi:hypothetical protein ILUMI_23886 [Ignelater luminosus]|uniref:Uncharacterized protein n=1 Tax=Ignelater luminosus TaxID=2038154 RepID=A0A8K0CD18_IGNLU|nr:hypothetical protein ILUMI_23886 [Ignelater luminosus]